MYISTGIDEPKYATKFSDATFVWFCVMQMLLCVFNDKYFIKREI